MNLSGQVYVPPPFSPRGKNPLYTLNRGCLGPTTGPGALEKIISVLLLRLEQRILVIEENA
jgi:hypothetical protein